MIYVLILGVTLIVTGIASIYFGTYSLLLILASAIVAGVIYRKKSRPAKPVADPKAKPDPGAGGATPAAKSGSSGWKWAFFIIIGLALLGSIVPLIGRYINDEVNRNVVISRDEPWFLAWEKPAGYKGINSYETAKEFSCSVILDGDLLIIRQLTNDRKTEIALFQGRRVAKDSRTFRGVWAQENPTLSGEFELTFSSNDMNFSFGWQTCEQSQAEERFQRIPMQVYKKGNLKKT